MTWVNKLQKRWGLHSTFDVWMVLFIFSITGSSTVFIRKPIFHYFELEQSAFWVKTLVYIAVVFPSYQIMFLFWGFVLRQWNFVWNFEKKILSRFGLKL